MKRIASEKETVIVLPLDEFESIRAELTRLDSELRRLLTPPTLTTGDNMRIVRGRHSSSTKPRALNAARSDSSDG